MKRVQSAIQGLLTALLLFACVAIFAPTQAHAVKLCGHSVYANGPVVQLGGYKLTPFYSVPDGSTWLCPEKIVNVFEVNNTTYVLTDGAIYASHRNWLGSVKFEPFIVTCYWAGLDSSTCDDFVAAELDGTNLKFQVRSGDTGVIDLINRRSIKTSK